MLNQLTRIRSEKCVSSEKTQQTLNAFKKFSPTSPSGSENKTTFYPSCVALLSPRLLFPTLAHRVTRCVSLLHCAVCKIHFFVYEFHIRLYVLCRETFLTMQLLKYYFIIKTPVWEFEFFVYEDITLCLILQPLFFVFLLLSHSFLFSANRSCRT